MKYRILPSLITSFLLGIIATVVLSNFYNSRTHAQGQDEVYRQLSLFGSIFDLVRERYVEERPESKLIEASINGMLSSLDPHSVYQTRKQFDDLQESFRGEFGGLGIEITLEDAAIKVLTPIDGTPAFRAGILAGDLITAVDGKSTKGLTLQESVDLMRGRAGTDIVLTIERGDAKQTLDIPIVRAVIKISPVRSRDEGDIGYIRLTKFNENSYSELEAAIEDLKASGNYANYKGIVLDIRNNPGGLLDQALEISDAFLEQGEIVSTRGRNKSNARRHNATRGDLIRGKDLIVLVNGGSASASEIVAGALKDHQRATIVGSRTFGKGSVQNLINLGRFGAVKLTTARYYMPSGESIQARGVTPDIELIQDLPEARKKELNITNSRQGEATLDGHLENENGALGEDDKPGSPAYIPRDPEDDTQLQLAYGLIRGTKKSLHYPKRVN